MSSFSTFGVTASTLGRYVHRLTFDASTSPTATEAGELINDRAAEWCAFLDSIGIDFTAFSSDTASQGYRLSQSWIGRAAAIDADRARGHQNTELAIAMADERDAIMQRVRERSAEFGADKPTGISAANSPHTSTQRAAYVTTALEGASLGRRLANSGNL